MGKPFGENSEDKSGVGAPKAVRICKHCRYGSYPATTRAPNRINITAPLYSFIAVGSRGYNACATACLPYKFWPGTISIVHNGEKSPSSSLMLT